jgi:H+/Cl- antiporter ClcA
MNAEIATQILGTFLKTTTTLIAITSAFYIYLLQRFRGRFLGYGGKDTDFRFESPSEWFWYFFVVTLAIMVSCSILMLLTSTTSYFNEHLDKVVQGVSFLSAVDFVVFGFTIKSFTTYPDRLRKFLKKYEVFELPDGSRMIRERK